MTNPANAVNWLELLQWTNAHVEELRLIAFVYFKESHYDQALVYFNALSILEPNNPYNWRMKAAVEMSMNNWDQAILSIDRSLELDPGHLGARLNRAKVLLYQGKIEEGLDEARNLALCEIEEIAHDAQALILSYG